MAAAVLILTQGTTPASASTGTTGFYATATQRVPSIIDEAGAISVLSAEQLVALTATYTLTSTTASQKIFNVPANGSLTVLGATSYMFECFFSLSSMSGTSGNAKFDVLGGGTATFTSAAFHVLGQDAATLGTAGTISGNFTATTITSSDSVTATVNTLAYFWVRGIFRVNAAGTVIPSVALTTAAAAVVGVNSYFRCWPVGSNTVTSVGLWT